MFRYYTFDDIVNGGQHNFEVEVSRDYFVGKFGVEFINKREQEIRDSRNDYCAILSDSSSKIYTIIYEKPLTKCNICGKLFDNKDTYEPYVCDDCFDKHFGYCDNCGEVFAYHSNMTNGRGVMCGKCLSQIKAEDWRK